MININDIEKFNFFKIEKQKTAILISKYKEYFHPEFLTNRENLLKLLFSAVDVRHVGTGAIQFYIESNRDVNDLPIERVNIESPIKKVRNVDCFLYRLKRGLDKSFRTTLFKSLKKLHHSYCFENYVLYKQIIESNKPLGRMAFIKPINRDLSANSFDTLDKMIESSFLILKIDKSLVLDDSTNDILTPISYGEFSDIYIEELKKIRERMEKL